MSKRANFVININTGVICFRNEETDKVPFVYRLVDDETARAVDSGKVSPKAVVDAAIASEVNAEGFSWSDYDRRRRDAEKAMNMSQRDMRPLCDADMEPEEEKPDDVNVIGLADIEASPSQKKPEKVHKDRFEKIPSKGVV